MKSAIITRSEKEHYQCQLDDYGLVYAVFPAHSSQDTRPVVGDHVLLSQTSPKSNFTIDKILPRKNEVYRLLIREKKKKVIASNIDLLVIMVSVSKPQFKQGLLDRYLLRSRQWNIPAIVVFNKCDQYQEKKSSSYDLEFERKRLDFLQVKSFTTSALNSEQFDMKELKKEIKNKRSLFVGQSGVGKSKLITCLSNGQYELLSAKLAKVGKGAHTTTWAELLNFKDFSLIDSPGIRTMSMEDIFAENLPYYFQDIAPWIQKCQFNDCQHTPHSKGCGFEHLDSQNQDDAIILSRLKSYLRLYQELKKMPTWLRRKNLRP